MVCFLPVNKSQRQKQWRYRSPSTHCSSRGRVLNRCTYLSVFPPPATFGARLGLVGTLGNKGAFLRFQSVLNCFCKKKFFIFNHCSQEQFMIIDGIRLYDDTHFKKLIQLYILTCKVFIFNHHHHREHNKIINGIPAILTCKL